MAKPADPATDKDKPKGMLEQGLFEEDDEFEEFPAEGRDV